MSDKNDKNQENIEQASNRSYKIKVKFIFLFLILFCLLFFSKNCFAFQLFKDNGIDKGKWEVVDAELTENRRIGVKAHLLPDGNVLIFGGTGIRLNQNTVDIFDPRQQKVIKTIKICNNEKFLSSSRYNTISLKNGDVYLTYDVIYRENENDYRITQNKDDFLHQFIQKSKIFDSKTYTFHDVKTAEKMTNSHELVLIKDGNILLFKDSPNSSYIYNVEKDEYNKINSPKYIWLGMIFYLENGDFIIFRGTDKRYLFKDYKFEEYKKELPTEFSTIQIDNENYLTLNAEYDCITGYVFNIKENKKKPVLNKINRTWGPNPHYPKLVLLDNKNVLILGIYANHQGEGKRKKYTTHIYNFEKNKFYQIPNPPLYINKDTATVKLPNGDIFFVGGQLEKKMEIYKYKHQGE